MTKNVKKKVTHITNGRVALVVFCLFIVYKNNYKLALNLNLNWMFQNNMYNKIFNGLKNCF